MKKLIVLAAVAMLISCTAKKEVNKYSIDQFYKNVNTWFAAFSPDESKVLVSSNETGIYNVFEISLSDGSMRQVTNSTADSFFAIDYVPGTSQILYSADKGGNELDHIYLLSDDGSTTDLTPGDAVKASFNGFSKDKKVMYFSPTVEIRSILICIK